MSTHATHAVSRRSLVSAGLLAGGSLVLAGPALGSEGAASSGLDKARSSALESAAGDAKVAGTFDVVVCGGGGAGLTAAYAALEKGASVLVLERADECGGTTASAEGAIQAAGTTWQRELGAIGVEGDSADRHYAFWLQAGEGFVEPDLVRAMADHAADNLQWMADSFGITFAKVFGCYPAPYTDQSTMADRIHLIADAADPAKTGGVVWTTNALAAVQAAGGTVLTGVRAVGLVRSGDEVAGVLAEDGSVYRARRGVVLAMSGIEHNEELAFKYDPQQYWDLRTQAVATAATDTGDGITMGLDAGADVGRFGGSVDLLLETWSYTNNTNPEIPYVLVNQRGARFVREDTTYAFHCRAIYNQCVQEGGFDPDGLVKTAKPHDATGSCWMVMDSKMTGVSQAAWSDPDKLQAALDDGSLLTADTLPELSKMMGIDPEVLQFTVDKWNADVTERGIDTVYHRSVQLTPLDEAPFYAWKTVNTNIGSIGGLKIDASAQVIGRDGKPIAHLFAAGTNAGGWLGPYYPGSGTCLQGTLHWGRTAGASAAAAPEVAGTPAA